MSLLVQRSYHKCCRFVLVIHSDEKVGSFRWSAILVGLKVPDSELAYIFLGTLFDQTENKAFWLIWLKNIHACITLRKFANLCSL